MITKRILQSIWIGCGIILLVLMGLAINTVLEARNAVIEFRQQVSSQVTIGDIRKGLDLIDKQLENDTLALEIEHELSLKPLPDNAETWEAFLDFCGRTGYVSTNPDNYLRFRYGKLRP